MLAWYLKDTGGNVEKYQLIVLESVVLFGCCIIFQKWRRPLLLLTPSLLCLLVINRAVNGEAGNLVQKDDYQEITADAWEKRSAVFCRKKPVCTGRSRAGYQRREKIT